ncbi:MAG: vacuolar transporter [Alkaliphilus sp.]|nr:MAG: vacuolar transporter [Alkaliphilus sp.]
MGMLMYDTGVNSKLRHELKYFISYLDYIAIKHRLKIFMKQDSHSLNEQGYYVKSLYFDDLDDGAMFEKQSGIINRSKIRIRTYNNSDQMIKLEKKSKLNHLIKKDSMEITIKEYGQLCKNDFSFLRSVGTKVSQELYCDFRSNVLTPKVIVEYTREAYIMHYDEIRVTFDKQLCSAASIKDFFAEEPVLFKALESNIIIMEIKYNSFFPDFLKSLMQIVSREKVAISKYVLCRELKTSLI